MPKSSTARFGWRIPCGSGRESRPFEEGRPSRGHYRSRAGGDGAADRGRREGRPCPKLRCNTARLDCGRSPSGAARDGFFFGKRPPLFEICGEACDGKEAVEKALALKPDVILMDVTMPVMNGLDAARAILRASPGMRIILLTMHDSSQIAAHAKAVGAAGLRLEEQRVRGVSRSDQRSFPRWHVFRGEQESAVIPRILRRLAVPDLPKLVRLQLRSRLKVRLPLRNEIDGFHQHGGRMPFRDVTPRTDFLPRSPIPAGCVSS